jgi:hypothetical protein
LSFSSLRGGEGEILFNIFLSLIPTNTEANSFIPGAIVKMLHAEQIYYMQKAMFAAICNAISVIDP